MSNVAQNILEIKKEIPAHVRLIAVSKTKPVSAIQEAYECGQRIFGENKVQELCDKAEILPKDIEWHMIGHLQSNKVKYMAGFVKLIHGVDSLNLLKEIDKQAKKNNRVQDVLLQCYIATEETKFGLSEEELIQILKSEEFKTLRNISVRGLMGMASFTSDENQIRKEFKSLKSLFEKIKTDFFSSDSNFSEISMGMSGDYKIAIEEGSTMVRIGSSIFGTR
ncbi:MAG: YggS family pyridoxal phosphate-dependent enzyme [Crocinitomicaceae bacterium]|nr:YggS family pyridoxal phosphate-dependent enzyme [Crocinitomicaceae bacterium]